MTSFYMKYNTGLKWAKVLLPDITFAEYEKKCLDLTFYLEMKNILAMISRWDYLNSFIRGFKDEKVFVVSQRKKLKLLKKQNDTQNYEYNSLKQCQLLNDANLALKKTIPEAVFQLRKHKTQIIYWPSLTYFTSMFHFYTPWKRKPLVEWRFSGGIEMRHWREKA